MQAHSSTSGWALSADSMDRLEMFSPPEMMMSLLRSDSGIVSATLASPSRARFGAP